MIYGKIAATALLVSSLALGGYAMAQQAGTNAASAQPQGTQRSQPAGAQPERAVSDIIARLSAQGYTDIGKVEREDGDRFEVKARNTDGQRVELYVDARTGEILKTKREDR